MENAERICRKLKPIMGRKAESLWKAYLAEDEKGKREIEELLGILEFKHLKNSIEDDKILLIPPKPEQAEGEFPLGTIIYNDYDVCALGLREEDFIKQIGIFAITGEGKTNVGMILALNLLKKKIPFIIIDWKRSWRNLLSLPEQKYPELNELRVYTVGRLTAPFYWNPFRPPPNVHWKTWLNIMAEVLEKSHIVGPGVADMFMKIYERIFREFGFGKENHERYPNFFDGLKELRKTEAYAREMLWKQSTGRVLKNFTFGPHSVCFNVRNPIKLEEILEKPVILELDQEMPKSLRTFFSEIILRWIHLYRLSKSESSKLKHVLFIEEIHNLFPKSKIEKESLSSLENVYREIRSFGQGLVSITQHTSLLPIYILGNSHTQITLGLQHSNDIEESKKSLFLEKGQEIYLDKLKVGEGIVKIKNRINPCYVKFPLVPINPGTITDEAIKKLSERYSGFSRDLELNIDENQGIPVCHDNTPCVFEIPPEAIKFLSDVNEFPDSSVVERYRRLQLSIRAGNGIKDMLKEKELIEQKKLITKKGWILIMKLTDKGIYLLREKNHSVADTREGIEHRFWKHRIAEHYRKQSYKVIIEKRVNGNADVVIMKGKEMIAVEIETESRRAVKNIIKDLDAGCLSVISVATNDEAEMKIKEELKKTNLSENSRVVLTNVSSFV